MADASQPQARTPLTAAAERVREAAKWLLAAFGAVGAVVVTGVALSDLGRVHGTLQRITAVSGALLALAGVVVAVLAAGNVVTQSFVTLTEIAQTASVTDRIALAGFDTAQAFRAAYESALTRRRQSAEQLFDHLANPPGPDGQGAKPRDRDEYDSKTTDLKAVAEANKERFRLYDALAAPLLERQSYLQVSAAYRRARKWMALGVLLAFFGVLVFVMVTTQPSQTRAPVVGDTPVQVSVSIKEGSRARYARLLGEHCNLNDVAGTAISNEGDVVVVAVPARDDCRDALLRLPPSSATVTRTDQSD